MRTKILLTALAFLTFKINAQSYFISFAGTGATTTVDSVKVENLTHAATVKLAAGDILHLFSTVGINELTVNDESIQIKPNPTQGQAEISFYAKESGVAQLSIYDISGRKIIQISGNFIQGIQRYQLSGLSKGMYSVNVTGEKYFYTAKLISLNTSQSEAKIKYIESSAVNDKQENIVSKSKSTKATVPMAYVTGDNIRFTGYSCNNSVVVNDIPTGSKTITFTFDGVTASISGATTICSGNNITLTASGGTSYLWNTNATTTAITVSPGNTTLYSVTVSSGSCTATASATVNVNPSPTASISGTTTINPGDNTTLTAIGGGTYLWNTSATTAAITVSPLSTTTYTVIVSNGTCTTAALVTVIVNSVGCPSTIMDIDGNTYNTVNINGQCWIKENLKTTKYNDNTAIPNVTGSTAWGNLTTGAYCDYNNSPSNGATYGHLYIWYAVNDVRKICPTGWHVPSNAEWTTLTDYLTSNGYGYGGSGDDIAKSLSATTAWHNDGNAGNPGNDKPSNNSSGFTALPGGYRDANGVFNYLVWDGYWWSTTANYGTYAWCRNIYSGYSCVYSNFQDQLNGFSVRCLMDQ